MVGVVLLKNPFTWIAILGALITWGGAVVNWHQDTSTPYKKILGVLWSYQIFFDSLPIFVPIFTFLGHIRRSPQLHAIALALFTASFAYLALLTHINLKLNSNTLSTHFGGLIAELIGMIFGSDRCRSPFPPIFRVCLSLAPIAAKFNGTIPGSLVNVGCALCWTVSTAVFAHLAKGSMFNITPSALSASFVVWHGFAGFSGLTSVSVGLAAVELWSLTQFVGKLPADSANANLGAAMPFVACAVHLAWLAYHFANQPLYDILKRQEDVLDEATGEEMVHLGLDSSTTPSYSYTSDSKRGAYSLTGAIFMIAGCIMCWYWDANGILKNNTNTLTTVVSLLVPGFTIIASFRVAPQLNALANFAFMITVPGLCSNAYMTKKLATPFFDRATPVEFRVRFMGLIFILGGIALCMCSLLRLTNVTPRKRPIFLAAPAAVAWIAAGIVNATIKVTVVTTPIGFGVIGIGLGMWCMYASIWSSTSSTVALATAEIIFASMWVLLVGDNPLAPPTTIQQVAGYLAIAGTVIHLIGLLVDFSLTHIRETRKKTVRNEYQLIN